MIRDRNRLPWFGVAAAAGVAMLAAGRVAAEDDRVGGEGEEQAEQQDNLVNLGANFDTNVFEQVGGGWVIHNQALVQGNQVPRLGGGVGAEGSPALARVRALGAARLTRLERACTLTEQQRRKLELALEADIRRCVADIEQVRHGYADATVNMREREGQLKFQRFQQDVQRCRRRLQTLFDEHSLFAESLPTVLDEAQFATMTAEAKERRTFRWRAIVGSAMLRLDDMLALDQQQHDTIERMLLEREPALRLDAASRQRNDHAEKMLVYMVLSEVDLKALRATVGEDRWKAVLTLSNQGRSMRSWIEGQGLSAHEILTLCRPRCGRYSAGRDIQAEDLRRAAADPRRR